MAINDFHSFALGIGISERTVKVIDHIRNSPPSRRVKSGGKNVPGRYPSVKMGCTIQFESHTLELANVYLKEHDTNVLEYYDQPPSFPIQYIITDKNGRERNAGHLYTPDYFVIENGWIGWEECKKEDELINLAIEYPSRYLLDAEGIWRCPPAEDYAIEQGLSFRIVTDKNINKNFLRNIVFLEDYLLISKKEEIEINPNLYSIVSENPGIQLETLIREYSVEADQIFVAIIKGNIFVDLYKHILAEASHTKVYIDKITATAYANMISLSIDTEINNSIINVEVGNSIQWDSKKWTFINVGESEYSLLSEENKLINVPANIFSALIKDGKITGIQYEYKQYQAFSEIDILKEASKEQLQAANRRFFYVMEYIQGKSVTEIPRRTLDDWVKKYNEAEIMFGNGYIGLIDNRTNQGNRNRRFTEEIIDELEKYIEEYYETIVQRNRSTVYSLFLNQCSLKGWAAPSFRTFCEYVKKHSTKHVQTRKRKGYKAAYSTEGFYWEIEHHTPRHGDRPFEIVHIDHTELDLEHVCSKTRKNLGRAWATFMVDAFSRRLLAVYITFDPPSYRSCMMVLRECVRRHQRLPKKIVVDGGKEFRSTYFETLLAWYKITKLERPGGKPRYGSVCERLFGTTNTSFINNLVGNTQSTKNVRQITTEVNPKKNAVWTLGAFFEKLCEWAYEVYDTINHFTLGCSPREAYQNGLVISGKRSFTMVSYDEVFYMLTLPTTRTGKAKLEPGYGVKINYQYFWTDKFLNPAIEGTKIPVRYDPYNMGIAYALVGKQWVRLVSSHYSAFVNRTEKEIRQASEEMKKRAKLHGKQITITAGKLAKFLTSSEAEEILLKQRLRDSEQKNVLEVIQGGKGINNTSNSIKSEDSTNVVTLSALNKKTRFVKPSFNRLEEF